jgi:hypothetical protein
MPGTNDSGEPRQGFRISVTAVVNAALSLTFLVLAAYIGWSSTIVTGDDRTQLRYFALLVAAYGIWRTVRTVLRSRRAEP